MADAHLRWERLAVGHVVGGLDEVDAAAFRAHLMGCRDCRARVGELRDIASSLTATERRERAAAGPVEVDVRAPEGAGGPAAVEHERSWRSWAFGAIAAAAATVLLLGGLAWSVWIQAENDVLGATTAYQERALDLLAAGRDVPWTGSEDVSGTVATDGTSAVVNLTGVPALQVDEGIVVWLLDADGAVVARSDPYLQARVADGRLTALLSVPTEAVLLLVTVEQDPVTAAGAETAPGAGELLRAELGPAAIG